MFHVGDVVRKLRLAQGWTIPDLAEASGLNKATVSSIERGDNHTRDSLGAVARALGCGDGASLESRLDAWAESRVGPSVMRAEWRVVIELWETIRADPEMQRIVLTLLRHEARRVQQRLAGEIPAVPAGLHPRRKARPRLRQTNEHDHSDESAIAPPSTNPPTTPDAEIAKTPDEEGRTERKTAV